MKGFEYGQITNPKRTKKVLEKADKPKEFTRVLQKLLKSYADREATKNYQRIIPSRYWKILWSSTSHFENNICRDRKIYQERTKQSKTFVRNLNSFRLRI